MLTGRPCGVWVDRAREGSFSFPPSANLVIYRWIARGWKGIGRTGGVRGRAELVAL